MALARRPVKRHDLDAYRDAEGAVNPVAVREHYRLMAAARYLTRWRVEGHDEAAESACEDFGHDVEKGVCVRCGRDRAELRSQWLAKRIAFE